MVNKKSNNFYITTKSIYTKDQLSWKYIRDLM